MGNSFLDYLQKTGTYSKHELSMLEKELQFISLKKDEMLLTKGEVCSSLCFLEEGAIIQFQIDEDLNEKVIDLNISNDWVINYHSFSMRKPSEYYIKSFIDSSIYKLSIDSIHRLIAQSQTFLQMGRFLGESATRLEFFDKDYSPDQKYQYILQNRAELLQKFSQKIIASYLKITPETLSRVRSRI